MVVLDNQSVRLWDNWRAHGFVRWRDARAKKRRSKKKRKRARKGERKRNAGAVPMTEVSFHQTQGPIRILRRLVRFGQFQYVTALLFLLVLIISRFVRTLDFSKYTGMSSKNRAGVHWGTRQTCGTQGHSRWSRPRSDSSPLPFLPSRPRTWMVVVQTHQLIQPGYSIRVSVRRRR